MEMQALRRSGWPFDHPVGFSQYPQDLVAFYISETIRERIGRG